jgi:hypothetical protein
MFHKEQANITVRLHQFYINARRRGSCTSPWLLMHTFDHRTAPITAIGSAPAKKTVRIFAKFREEAAPARNEQVVAQCFL